MKVSEEDQAGAKQRIFGDLRLFDLHDHVSLLPNVFRCFDYSRASAFVGAVGQGATESCAFLNQHFVIARDETSHTGGRDRNAALFGFDFFRHADDHRERLNDGRAKGKSKRQ